MLTDIQIKNFAIIQELSLSLKNGMTVLTGETGAGKSILIDALELALGKRLTTPTQQRTDITLNFDLANIPSAMDYLTDNELVDEQNCIVRRVIDETGKSKSFINGIPATLQTVRTLANHLIHIHGQHEFQTLFETDAQRQLLDQFAEHDSLLKTLRDYHAQYADVQKQYETLKSLQQTAADRIDFLSYQIKELESLALDEHSIQDINQEHEKQANIDKLKQQSAEALNALEYENAGATTLIYRAKEALEHIATYDKRLANVRDLLNQASIFAEEATQEIKQFVDELEMDEARFAWLEKQLEKIHELSRKHRISPEELPALLENMQQELTTLSTSDEMLLLLEQKLKEIEGAYSETAEKLSASRKKYAKKLSAEIETLIQSLGMPEAKFEIAFTPNENKFSAEGLENVNFLISANPGQTLQPINLIASGGELSRVSLAIDVATAQKQNTPALIFDEVDIGVGGATAERVGKCLKQLSQKTQVFCITHLPQVAVKGDQHLYVTKKIISKKTETQVAYLNEKERVAEIARMSGGIQITEQTLKHAKALLED